MKTKKNPNDEITKEYYNRQHTDESCNDDDDE